MSHAPQAACQCCQQNVEALESAEQTINVMDQDIADLTASCNTLTIENEKLRARLAACENESVAA